MPVTLFIQVLLPARVGAPSCMPDWGRSPEQEALACPRAPGHNGAPTKPQTLPRPARVSRMERSPLLIVPFTGQLLPLRAPRSHTRLCHTRTHTRTHRSSLASCPPDPGAQGRASGRLRPRTWALRDAWRSPGSACLQSVQKDARPRVRWAPRPSLEGDQSGTPFYAPP